MNNNATKYAYQNAVSSHHHAYLLPTVIDILHRRLVSSNTTIFDLGCGNGSIGNSLSKVGYKISGVDPSTSGIEHARLAYPYLSLHIGSAYDDLAAKFGNFDAVISLEVVEHVYDPRHYARTLRSIVKPGGFAVLSTPYHSYIKNLALAITGRMDKHFTALWDHGHIKFWSVQTLSALMNEVGLTVSEVHRVGRISYLAKSMIMVVDAPKS